jgi:para-aminobenzoate synthetase component I
MNDIKKITGQIIGIHEEQIFLEESFLDFSRRFASMEGTAVFMSGGNLDCARYHILGAKPWLTLKGRHRNMMITSSNQSIDFKADPFDMLHRILNTCRLNDLDMVPSDLTRPIAAGLFGYCSYDLKDVLEKLPRTSIDDLRLPHLFFFAPSIIVVHDKADNSTRLCIPKRTISGEDNWAKDLETFKQILSARTQKKQRFTGNSDGFKSNFTQTGYMSAIKKIKEYIAAGDVYQVNMSQRFEMDFEGDAFSLFAKLYIDNPAPFFSFLNAGEP